MAQVRDPNNPLSEDTIARLRRDRAVLNQTHLDIQGACQCGLDMRGEQALCDALCSRIDALLQQYGGDR